MKYLKAFPQDTRPFVSFHFWAGSIEKLIEMGLENDPQIIAESDLPELVNGVYPIKIENEALVTRSASEIATFEASWNELQNQNLVKQKRNELIVLFNEIAFAGSLNEDTTALEATYATKLTEYTNLQTS